MIFPLVLGGVFPERNMYSGSNAGGEVYKSLIPDGYWDNFIPSQSPGKLLQMQVGSEIVTAEIRFDHILDGGVNTLKNGSKVGTGGHYLRSGNVRVTEITGAADSNGVSTGYVSIRDPATGRWISKPTETSFYPEYWSKRQTILEIEGAFQNSIPNPANLKQWIGRSPSGIPIQGYYGRPAGTGATAWPVYKGR